MSVGNQGVQPHLQLAVDQMDLAHRVDVGPDQANDGGRGFSARDLAVDPRENLLVGLRGLEREDALYLHPTSE